ncbi:MAG: RNA polymerase sigma-70 factor [Actinomycetota bacterium]|nr:RNA polymerase sigma-70 factor [Actinomycetota bacterium]
MGAGPSGEVYKELRPLAFSIAYRMLGSASEAEDVVQEGMLRLHRALEGGEGVDSPRAYLSTVVTRLAIDELRSARARREVYVGEWLPEPILTTDGAAGAADPAAEAEVADSLSLSFLVVLESLTPEQRAAFLLREVFDYPYELVAEILGKSEPAARQLVSRARGELDERRPRFETSREQRERLARRFMEAARDGDLAGLEALLADDVELHGDGGGKAPALSQVLRGRSRVAKTLRNWMKAAGKFGIADVQLAEVNGQPGAVFRREDGSVFSVVCLEISDGHIQRVNSVVNPEKLTRL